eukprot:2528330-Amphidinium_carterae.1
MGSGLLHISDAAIAILSRTILHPEKEDDDKMGLSKKYRNIHSARRHLSPTQRNCCMTTHIVAIR